MMKKILFIILILAWGIVQAIDKTPTEFVNSSQESRYKTLTAQLRCVVCQNQSLADSNAELAQDLRDQVRDKILQGQTDEQITEFFLARYGDFVLYNPPLKPTTYLLWISPLLLLLIAFASLGYFIHRQAKTTATSTELTEAERAKLKQIIGE